MSPTPWTSEQIPNLDGKLFLVTGANSGLGFETSRALARHGARVLLACRDAAKADRAIAWIRQESPRAQLEVIPLDLASLASIRAFVNAFRTRHQSLDGLINNAGVMALPRRKTADGFEMQIGTNHLGHFALTGQLLDTLLATPSSRVVNLSSTMHRAGACASTTCTVSASTASGAPTGRASSRTCSSPTSSSAGSRRST
jgi:NAD(P)-dependent dehydrogenase (short-subunit alcohol dehydrogenase family)